MNSSIGAYYSPNPLRPVPPPDPLHQPLQRTNGLGQDSVKQAKVVMMGTVVLFMLGFIMYAQARQK